MPNDTTEQNKEQEVEDTDEKMLLDFLQEVDQRLTDIEGRLDALEGQG